MKKKAANEKWIDDSIRQDQRMAETIALIERILAREAAK